MAIKPFHHMMISAINAVKYMIGGISDQFTQSGIELSRTTMARWIIQVSEKFTPLYAPERAPASTSGGSGG